MERNKDKNEGILEIDSGLALLAPPDDAPRDEKEAFQTLINDIFRWGAAYKNGKTKVDIYEESHAYFKAHPRELGILLDIFTQGKCGTVDVMKFKTFDVRKLKTDLEYVRVLESIWASIKSRR